MPLDGFTLHFLTGELRRDIVGCRVEKVHQPSKDELVMHLRDRIGTKSPSLEEGRKPVQGKADGCFQFPKRRLFADVPQR